MSGELERLRQASSLQIEQDLGTLTITQTPSITTRAVIALMGIAGTVPLFKLYSLFLQSICSGTMRDGRMPWWLFNGDHTWHIYALGTLSLVTLLAGFGITISMIFPSHSTLKKLTRTIRLTRSHITLSHHPLFCFNPLNQAISFEDIRRVDFLPRNLLDVSLRFQTREHTTSLPFLIARADRPALLALIRDQIERRRQALTAEGHDISTQAKPPAALERLRQKT